MNATKTLLAAALAALSAGWSAARADDGRTFILTVSVANCPKMPSDKFTPLPYADAAATKLHNALLRTTPEAAREPYMLNLSRAEVSHPTVDNIRRVLKLFARQAKPEDRVIVVFLGHGFENPDGAVVVAADSELRNPDSFLAVREIVGRVKALPCRDKCVFIDACRDFKDDIKVSEAKDYVDPFEKERMKHNVQRKAGAMVLVQSCAPGLYAYLMPKGGGLMTENLIKAFDQPGAATDADGNVTVRAAVEYARKQVRDDARHYHRAVQDLSDESSGEPFLMAKLEKGGAAQPGGAGGTAVATRGPLPYSSETLTFGPPPSPSMPAAAGSGGYGNAGGYGGDRPVLNALAQGIQRDGAVGQALNMAHSPNWTPPGLQQLGVPAWHNPIPGNVQRYIPSGGNLGGFVGQFLR